MRKVLLSMLCGAGLLFSGAAMANSQNQAQGSKEARIAKTNPEKISCRYVYHNGYAYRAPSNCGTEAQWRVNRQMTQQSFREMQQRSLYGRP